MPFVTRLENFGLITKNKGLKPRTHPVDADLSEDINANVTFGDKCRYLDSNILPNSTILQIKLVCLFKMFSIHLTIEFKMACRRW